jgi:hypothetical protein
MSTIKIFVLVFGLLSLSNCVMASQEGDGTDPVVVGSVSDALSKKPMKGVTISILSAKDRISKCFTTDAAGKFSMPKLPAGEVTITLEKKGYKKEKIVLKDGSQVKLNFDMKNEPVAEEDDNLFHPLLRIMQS